MTEKLGRLTPNMLNAYESEPIGDVGVSVSDRLVRVEISNHDPVDGLLEWAELSIADAVALRDALDAAIAEAQREE